LKVTKEEIDRLCPDRARKSRIRDIREAEGEDAVNLAKPIFNPWTNNIFLMRNHLRLHDHSPQQLAIWLAIHQQAGDELGCDQLGGAGEE